MKSISEIIVLSMLILLVIPLFVFQVIWVGALIETFYTFLKSFLFPRSAKKIRNIEDLYLITMAISLVAGMTAIIGCSQLC